MQKYTTKLEQLRQSKYRPHDSVYARRAVVTFIWTEYGLDGLALPVGILNLISEAIQQLVENEKGK